MREVLDCLTGAVCLLKKADSDHLMCGKLWKLLNDAHLRLKGMEETNPKLVGVADLFYKRWTYAHHPVHSLAYVLNPKYSSTDPLSDPSIERDVNTMLKRYYPVPADRATIKASMLQYLNRQHNFSPFDEDGDDRLCWTDSFIQGMSPWDWWSRFRIMEPMLAPLAIKVLQIAVSSSPCERHFSKWAYLISKYRTRLTLSRQHKAIYCYSNWRFFEQYEGDKWYCSASESDSE